MHHPKAKAVKLPFKYVPACATDIRKTFARIKRENAKLAPLLLTYVKDKP